MKFSSALTYGPSLTPTPPHHTSNNPPHQTKAAVKNLTWQQKGILTLVEGAGTTTTTTTTGTAGTTGTTTTATEIIITETTTTETTTTETTIPPNNKRSTKMICKTLTSKSRPRASTKYKSSILSIPWA